MRGCSRRLDNSLVHLQRCCLQLYINSTERAANYKQGNFALSPVLKPCFVSEILTCILNILIRNYGMPLVCANSSCIITEDELIFQASICFTQIRQGLFAKGWPRFLAGSLGDAVPDSFRPMRKGSAGTSQGPRGQPRGRGSHPRESGAQQQESGHSGTESGVQQAPSAILSRYLMWRGSTYPLHPPGNADLAQNHRSNLSFKQLSPSSAELLQPQHLPVYRFHQVNA